MSIFQKLEKIKSELKKINGRLEDEDFKRPLENLQDAANQIGQSWSGSWFGYHSRVYYKDFQKPPPGAEFSIEWGLKGTFQGSKGDWVQYDYDDVIALIEQKAGNPKINELEQEAKEAAEKFEELKFQMNSILTSIFKKTEEDAIFSKLKKDIDELKIVGASEFVTYLQPSGQMVSRDMLAIEKGFITPPHIKVLSCVFSIEQPFSVCADFLKLIKRLETHLANTSYVDNSSDSKPSFSKALKDPKRFIGDEWRKDPIRVLLAGGNILLVLGIVLWLSGILGFVSHYFSQVILETWYEILSFFIENWKKYQWGFVGALATILSVLVSTLYLIIDWRREIYFFRNPGEKEGD
jgi:hypothetical protein